LDRQTLKGFVKADGNADSIGVAFEPSPQDGDAADVAANGNMTASEKFKGFQAKHDMKPNVGDRICPITETKANPNCVWIVDGKKYEFCCPPCVDEFVKMANGSTDPFPAPESYLKK
jgi:hypothetical protein